MRRVMKQILLLSFCFFGCFGKSQEVQLPTARPSFPHLSRQRLDVCHLVRSFDAWVLAQSVGTSPPRLVRLPEGDFWATPVRWRTISTVVATPRPGSGSVTFTAGEEFEALDNSDYKSQSETRFVPITRTNMVVYSDLAHSLIVGAKSWPNTIVTGSDLTIGSAAGLLVDAANRSECARQLYPNPQAADVPSTRLGAFDAGAYQ
jgi:hypothetical protein